jgi:beta-phosphoglucomutase
MLKGIIFDLDGVIVDSHSAHKKAWRTLLTSLGRAVSEEELDFVVEGRKRDTILQHFLGPMRGEELRHYGTMKDALFTEAAHEVSEIAGARELVEQVSAAGLALAVGTSAGRRRAEDTLHRMGLSTWFKAVVTGDDVQAGKPDPAVFQRAAERLGIGAERLLVCEDAIAGVQAAKSAGMKCLAIAARGRGALLKQAGADEVRADFRGIRLQDLNRLFEE